MCDFGHAVRLYVDPRSTGGTEKYGEKEVKRRRHEKKRKREREKRERGAERDREDSIYSAFVPSSSRERESPSTRLDSNSLVTTTGETDRGGKRRSPNAFEGKDETREKERKILRERERESEATEVKRRKRDGYTPRRLRTHSSRRDQAATVYKTLYMQVDTEKETRRRGKGGKERKTHSPGSPCVR